VGGHRETLWYNGSPPLVTTHRSLMSETDRCDVLVIGGGPAGSTVASYLARDGFDVVVLERAVFPRDHVGESLLPFCYGIFDELGLLEEISQRYVRKPGVRFLDVDGVTETTYCFHLKIKDPSYLSFQVLRSEFDELLLNHSERLGARVHQGTKVEAVDFHGPEDITVRAVTPTGETVTFSPRFVIDASGRETFLANRMQTKTAHKELARSALSSHWRGARYEGGLQEGMIQIVYIGGEKLGWIWVIPLSTDRLSVGVVMSTAYFRAERLRLKQAGVDNWQQALYTQELEESAFTKHILDGAEQFWPIQYNGDYSYFCHQKWGDDFGLCGDASAFIDPIFSSGVYLAMNSGRLLSRAVATRLRDGLDAGREALEQTYETIVGAYELVDKLIRVFYTPEAINFAQLGNAGDAFADYDHHQNAMGLQHFLLAGDFFEQANRYSEFVDELRSKDMFRRYQTLVIDRDTFQAPAESSCHHTHDQIFHPMLAEYDRLRAERGI
jgi:flavin-dependent dehydrogenase